MIHDITVWRIDQIYAAGDELWLETVSSPDGSDVADLPSRWTRVTDGAALLVLLSDVGLAEGSSAPQDGGTEPAAAPTRIESGAAEPGRAPIAAAALLGLLVGTGGTLLLRRAR